MIERQNRTIICSVLFLDMVEYSRKPVAEQMRLREIFNVLLHEALKGVATGDRVILDTGDGAAVTFLGDPEDALFMALTLRDSIAAEARAADPELRLRCGINLGPVKLVKDLNARPNIIGDGINVAQRIMAFSQPGQMLVSRSYFEVVSRLSSEYSNLFKYEGARTDKHVREHEVYAVSGDHPIPTRTSELARPGRLARLGRAGALLEPLVRFASHGAQRLFSRPRVSTMVTAAVILTLGVVVRGNRDLSAAPMLAKGSTAMQPVALSDAQRPFVAGAAEKPAAPAIAPAAVVEPAALAAPPGAAAEATVKNVSASEPALKKSVPIKPAKAAPKKDVDGEMVSVSLAVFPWGEVYVDGKQRGVSPPVRTIQLSPGRHEIEFRNTTFPNHVETVEVKAGDHLTVRHKFDAGASR